MDRGRRLGGDERIDDDDWSAMTATPTVELPEPLRLLAPDGTLAEGHVPALEGDALLGAWRAMLLSRVCDERCFSLQRQGRLGTFSPVNGEEAAVVGTAGGGGAGRARSRLQSAE